MRHLLFYILVCVGQIVGAQTYRFTPFPAELYFGVGPVIYQGDLPSTNIFTSASKANINPKELNIAITAGLGYRIKKKWAVRNNLSYITFSGNDALDDKKKVRNLSFRTQMLEYNPLIEYSFIHWDANPNNIHHHVYVGAGISLFYFNPQAMYLGKYYNLQPLSTEGQGFTGRKLPYSRISVALPMVGGYRYRVSKKWVMGIELSLRKSFSDYLDDVSTNYYSNEVIRVNKGEVAAQLADKNLTGKPYSEATNRGNPKKADNYFYALFQMSYFLKS